MNETHDDDKAQRDTHTKTKKHSFFPNSDTKMARIKRCKSDDNAFCQHIRAEGKTMVRHRLPLKNIKCTGSTGEYNAFRFDQIGEKIVSKKKTNQNQVLFLYIVVVVIDEVNRELFRIVHEKYT